MSDGDALRWLADRLTPPENPTPEELERILRPGLPPTGPVERFATWGEETPTEGGTMHYVRSVDSFVASASDLLGYVAPDAPALFRRPIPEIRARAATSRYWAQRLRWLRKRGRA